MSEQYPPSTIDPILLQKIEDLISYTGSDPHSFESDLVAQMIQSSLKMTQEGYDGGQLKLMVRAFKEMRYAYQIFNQYPSMKRVSIFGSARTPMDHPNYTSAKSFAAKMAAEGWLCITGAADGIMKAGIEGASVASSFGLSIRLPFEHPSDSLLTGDPKLITFRYFFTRKLMFLSHSDAIAAYPGGVGTQDELFEVLTLMQTGRGSIIPVVLLQGENETYWTAWNRYVHENLLDKGWISPEDFNFYHMATSVDDAVQHIQQFYRRYHSSRYVKDDLVIRMRTSLSDLQLGELNNKFSKLVLEGVMRQSSALEEETDHRDLPRLVFNHTKKDFGLLRVLIDEINLMN